MKKKMKMLAVIFASVLMIGALSACGSDKEEETTTAAETTTVEETTAAEVEYTQQKVATVTLPFGNVELTCKANEDISAIDITFFAFDEDQQLTGTVTDGKFTPNFDKSGFFGGDAQTMYDGIMADAGAWTPVE